MSSRSPLRIGVASRQMLMTDVILMNPVLRALNKQRDSFMIDFRSTVIPTLLTCAIAAPFLGLGAQAANASESTNAEDNAPVEAAVEDSSVDQMDDTLRWLPDPANNPLVFITSSCAVCKLNEPMRVGFAADQAGSVTVLLLNPDGEQTTLLSQEVEANEIAYVTAVATAPAGEHALIALFGEQSDSLAKTLANLFPSVGASETTQDEQKKGLQLLPEPESLIPHAIRQFDIID